MGGVFSYRRYKSGNTNENLIVGEEDENIDKLFEICKQMHRFTSVIRLYYPCDTIVLLKLYNRITIVKQCI